MTSESETLARPVSTKDLFVTFTALALQGFGGVLPVAQRVLCDQKRWLTKQEFVEILAIGQVLPGPNICNLSLMIGDRFFGWRGACAALAGMMAVPLAIVLGMTALYAHYAWNPAVAGALKGMGAVSAGMIIGTALKLSATLRANPIGMRASVALGAAAFVGVALLRWPLVWILLGAGAVGCGYAWRCVKLKSAPSAIGQR